MKTENKQQIRDLCDKVSELAMRIKWATNEAQHEDAFQWHQRLETLIGKFYNIPEFEDSPNIIEAPPKD